MYFVAFVKHADFGRGAGHSADRQTKGGRFTENYSMPVFWRKRFVCGLLPNGAG